MDLGGTSGLGCVATMVLASPKLAGGADTIGCEDVSVRPKSPCTFWASVSTGFSFGLTLAGEDCISARRDMFGNGLKPAAPIQKADAVNTVATKMVRLPFVLRWVG